MFICGSGSVLAQDDQDECPTPKRSKRSSSFCKIIGKKNRDKNRFADGGLDKFYALLTDLDHKKQKIYTRMGAEDISFVRFVYNGNSNRVKPIVVKANKPKNAHRVPIKRSQSSMSQVGPEVEIAVIPKEDVNDQKPRKRRKCLRGEGRFNMDSLKRPCLYLPVIFVLVMMFLAIYGRSFAILCTSIGWFMVATVEGEKERKPKRMEYVRRPSEKKVVQS